MQISYSFGWNPGPKVHLAIAILMFITAAFIAIVLYQKTTYELSTSATVDGVVVESKTNSNGMHTPVIEFRHNEGKIIRFKSKYSSRPQKYFTGDKVKILLNNETGKPKLKNMLTIYGLPLFAAMFSLICLVGSIAIYFIRIRNKN